VAEYVETAEVFFALKEIGVDYGQGYFIARPVPIDKVLIELEKIKNNPIFYQDTLTSL
jgi:EAL domain-containing protein (putative c-di-GMP-specific phosphodiesterase class I)